MEDFRGRHAISQTLSNSAKPMPKMSSGGPKTPIYQKMKIVAKCCRMLQDVARHCISKSGCQTTSRTTASKSPSRNYSKKSKSSFKEFSPLQRCKPEPPKSCKTCNTPSHRHHHRSGVSARPSVPPRSRSDQPFGRYVRKCLNKHTHTLTNTSRPTFFQRPTGGNLRS